MLLVSSLPARAEDHPSQKGHEVDERAAMRQWVTGALLGDAPPAAAPARPSIEIRRQDYHLGIRESVMRTPLRLGGKTYPHGLGSHSTSELAIHLPGPAQRLDAVVGIDENPNTSGGRGSVVFSVAVGDKVTYKTKVVREGTPAQPVNVDLAGAETFTLEVGDAGDGISCDQADWADAKVTLADGRQLWLGDLPLGEREQLARERDARA